MATDFSEEPKDISATVATLDDEALLRDLPFDASVREACEGVEVAFELQGLDREMSFLWNFGDGSFSSDPSPKHTFMRPGLYDITLSVRSPGDGFIRTRTIQNMITRKLKKLLGSCDYRSTRNRSAKTRCVPSSDTQCTVQWYTLRLAATVPLGRVPSQASSKVDVR